MFYTISEISPICQALKARGQKIVLATGFFDLLHEEHINFLQKAKAVGDILIVAVESDTRARVIKGEGRPIETQSIRCQKVSKYADYIVALNDDFNTFEAYESLMAAVTADIYAVSSHSDHLKSKTFLAEKYGGKLVIVHDHNPLVSTTQIINNKNQL